MNARKRNRLWIDPNVQGTLVARIVTYWLACMLGVFLLLACVPAIIQFAILDNPPSVTQMLHATWISFWPAVFASFVLLPFIIRDCLRVSNRFVGPIFRIRRAMKQLADGESVEDIRFRDADFWFDFAEDFNRVARLLDEQRGNSSDDEVEQEQAEEVLSV